MRAKIALAVFAWSTVLGWIWWWNWKTRGYLNWADPTPGPRWWGEGAALFTSAFLVGVAVAATIYAVSHEEPK